MKILIFEYISGGGFCATDLPESLAREGGLMLNALLNDFAKLFEHELVLILDERCVAEFSPKNINFITVNPTAEIFSVFEKALQNYDAAWIIAPETDNILFDFTQLVEKYNKLLLSVPSSAIAKTADKLQTFNLLTTRKILTIPTQRLSDLAGFEKMEGLPLVIKPIDGVSCKNSLFIQNFIELKQIFSRITPFHNYIIQPFICGDALSVSALFKHGQAQLLCVNRQVVALKNQQFKLTACEVNIAVDNKDSFQTLLNHIAEALPDLFGYVGIDLIASRDKYYVVEINPRLTSSYSGINQALGINVADLVLQSINGDAKIKPLRNQTVVIHIAQEKIDAI